MRITYHAWIADKVGLREEEVELPADVESVADLIRWLSGRGPEFEEAFEFSEVLNVAVNSNCAQGDQPVRNEDRVSFIPPIAGG